MAIKETGPRIRRDPASRPPRLVREASKVLDVHGMLQRRPPDDAAVWSRISGDWKTVGNDIRRALRKATDKAMKP